MPRLLRIALLSLALLAMAAPAALAAGCCIGEDGGPLGASPSVEDILRALGSHDGEPRGIIAAPVPSTLGVEVVSPRVPDTPRPPTPLDSDTLSGLAAEGAAPSISVTVAFETGTTQLTAASKRAIDVVAKAINAPEFKQHSILVAGHSNVGNDVTGGSDLSEALAQAVADYLELEDQVDPRRLIAQGFGTRFPYNPADPSAPENQRVQFITLD